MFGLSNNVVIVFGIIGVAVLILIILFMSYYRTIITIANFAYPNAKLKAIGTPFINKEQLLELLESRSVSEVLSKIEAEGYKIEDGNIEYSLDKTLISQMKALTSSMPEGARPLFDAYLTKLDVNQLKNIIRMKNSGVEKEEILKKALPVKNLTSELISDLADAKDIETMVSMLKETPFNDAFKTETYDPMISYEANSEDFTEKPGAFPKMERMLDKYVYEKLRNATLKVDVDVAPCVSVFVGRYADIMNLKILIRSRKTGYDSDVLETFLVGKGREMAEWKLHEMALATNVQEIISETEGTTYAHPLKEALPEYEKTGSVYPLEAALDRHLLKTMSALSLEHGLTVGIPIRFAVAKEYEVRNINAVIKGVSEGMSPEKIKPLLITEDAL